MEIFKHVLIGTKVAQVLRLLIEREDFGISLKGYFCYKTMGCMRSAGSQSYDHAEIRMGVDLKGE